MFDKTMERQNELEDMLRHEKEEKEKSLVGLKKELSQQMEKQASDLNSKFEKENKVLMENISGLKKELSQQMEKQASDLK